MEEQRKTIILLLTIITLFFIFYVLIIGSAVFIPIVLSFLLSILLISCYSFFKNYFRSRLLSGIVTVGTFGIILYLIFFIISSQLNAFYQEIPLYEAKLKPLILSFFEYTGFQKEEALRNILSKINITNMVYTFGGGLTLTFGNTFLIFFYTLFLIIERKSFSRKFHKVFGKKDHKRVIEITNKIQSDISSFFVLKFFIALTNGFLAYVILSIFGVHFALLFALFVFLLDFIPNIGGIIAIIIPFLFSFLQFDSLTTPFFVLLSLISAQTLMGNFIEPKLIGNKLNLSPIVIIFSLVFWGTIWGVMGALLAMPLMTMMNIAFSKFESTRWVSVMLSEKGDLE